MWDLVVISILDTLSYKKLVKVNISAVR